MLPEMFHQWHLVLDGRTIVTASLHAGVTSGKVQKQGKPQAIRSYSRNVRQSEGVTALEATLRETYCHKFGKEERYGSDLPARALW